MFRLSRPSRLRLFALTGVTATALAAAALPSTLVAAQASPTPAASAFAPQLVTVHTPTRGDKVRLQTLGLDLTEHAGHDYVEAVLHTAADLSALRGAGFSYDVRIPDLVRREAEVNAANAAYAASVARSPLPSGRTDYRTLADYGSDMAALAKAKPKVARTLTLKRPSLDGRKITAIEIAGNVKAAADTRPTFLLMGVHHAREWPSGELAMEFATDLVNGYGSNARITRLLDQARVLVVPVVNVDGFEMSRTDGAMVDLRDFNEYDPLAGTSSVLATPGSAYKRKNCRMVDGQDTPDGSCRIASANNGGYGLGVDLNRNYGGFWGGPGADTAPAGPTYRGAEAFSEPEILNIRDLVSSRQVTMMISNHTFSNLVLRPNGVNPKTLDVNGLPVGNAPDEKALKAVGARFAAQNGYANIHGWELYDTTGTTEDWSYNATGGFGYTFEIGPDEFHPPYPEVIDEYLGAGKYAGRGNRAAYLIALEEALNPELHARIAGSAPKGAVLRLRKSFETPTWESSFKDSLNSVMVSRGGSFTWHVNPSTRPVSMPRVVLTTTPKVVRSQTWEGGATMIGDAVDHPFTLTEKDADELRITLDWPVPDDFDLEVYKKVGDDLVQVGTSGNAPGDKELVEIADPSAGEYVLRVINFAAVSPTYTLTADVVRQVVTDRKVVGGKVEQWTLTCEKKGKVLQTVKVQVERGDLARVNLSLCNRRF